MPDWCDEELCRNEFTVTDSKGAKEVLFSSDSAENPAKFYMVSAPAHTSYETRLIKIADAAKNRLVLLKPPISG